MLSQGITLLALNSRQSFCLSLPRAGMTGVTRQTPLICHLTEALLGLHPVSFMLF